MSTKYKISDNEGLYFVSFAVVYWIDLFIRNEYREIVLDSWRYCLSKKGLEIYCWVIMTSHIHMIIGSRGEKMENIMRDMKRFTSGQLKKAIIRHPGESRREWLLESMQNAGKANSNNIDFQLWRQDNHPIYLNNPEIINNTMDYIHFNPVVAGFVSQPEDYLYSSATDYRTNRKGLINLVPISPIIC